MKIAHFVGIVVSERLVERVPNAPMKSSNLAHRKGPRLQRGMEAGPEQGFRDVDVTETCDAALVHQERLDGQTGTGKEMRELRRREGLPQRLHTQAAKLLLDTFVDKLEGAQTADVNEGKLSTSSQMENHAACPRQRFIRTPHHELATHSKMSSNSPSPAHIPDQMFSPTVDPSDRGTTQGMDQLTDALSSQCQPIEDTGVQNTPANEPTLQVSPGDLDFG